MTTFTRLTCGILAAGLVPVSARAQVPVSHPFRAAFEAVPLLAADTQVLELDSGIVLQSVTAVAGAPNGDLYVLHRPDSGDPVIVLDRTGHLVNSWGAGMIEAPHSIRVDASGAIWTVDATRSEVLKFAANGTVLLRRQFDRPSVREVFCGATDIAFGRDGLIFISDGYCNGRILVLDASGEILREWGSIGSAEGAFQIPHAVAVGPDDLLYVADRENGRIQRFDSEGRLVGVWQLAGQLLSLAFAREGALYASLSLGGGPVDAHIVEIDAESGEMTARIEMVAHELDVAPDGTLLPATSGSDVVLIRPRYR